MLLKAKREGKTVFLSSHMLSEIELICDRIGILHRGRLVRLGTVRELLVSKDEYEILAANLKSAIAGAMPGKDGLTQFVVPAGEQREYIERIWANGGEVVSVLPVKRSLEDVFLSLTTETSELTTPPDKLVGKDEAAR
jgi:ABC-2 type transport system ATP-binding protein